MARRKRKSSAWPLLIAVAILGAGAAAGWALRHRVQAWLAVHGGSFRTSAGTPVSAVDAIEVSAARVDPANEGRHVRVNGSLEASAPARDAELGVSAKDAVLLRRVEMYQWRENCSGDDCRYAAEWSESRIDSHRFRHAEGHENPPQKLANAQFVAAGLRLGGFTVGADLVAAQATATELVVHAAELPPNLAASFGDAGGALYAGGDPAHPKVGEMRISYRVVPLGPVALSGVQHGATLAPE